MSSELERIAAEASAVKKIQRALATLDDASRVRVLKALASEIAVPQAREHQAK